MGEAVVELNQAIRLRPDSPHAYNARGYAYLRLKDYKRAIADFDQAIRLDPQYGNAYHNRGVARRGLGDREGAEADLAKEREFSGR